VRLYCSRARAAFSRSGLKTLRYGHAQPKAAFPEMKELKQLVRDRIAPERDLGHSDRVSDS